MNLKPKQRPSFFTALCLLSFLGSSIGFLGYFLASLLFDKASEWIVKYSSWHSTDEISPLYFTLLMALYAFSLTGVIRMWKRHSDGLFLYVFAQLFILFLPVIWINRQSFSSTNAIFTTVFIVGYSMHWKWFRS